MARFSIITITNNDKDGFAKTMQSVQEQSFKDYEWIVVHGGSKDGTLDLIKENSRDIAWHCSGKDTGLYNAMNIGTDQAKGDYLIYMNGGDCFAKPDILEHIHAHAAAKNNPDYIYGDSIYTDPVKGHRYVNAYGMGNLARSAPASHQAAFFKNKTVDSLRYDESYKIAADFKFQLDFLQHASTYAYTPKPVCVFDATGISNQQHYQTLFECYKVRRDSLKQDFSENAWQLAKHFVGTTLIKISPELHQNVCDILRKFKSKDKVAQQQPSTLDIKS